MSEGWIKLHREIADHWIWQNPEQLRSWLDLLMLANHKPKKIKIDNQIVEVSVGQRWTSYESLAKRWGCSIGKVRRFLDLLESDGMIQRESTSRGTLITLVNYRVYQGFSEKKSTPTDLPTDLPTENQRTSQRYTNNNDIRMSNNDKEIIGGRQ